MSQLQLLNRFRCINTRFAQTLVSHFSTNVTSDEFATDKKPVKPKTVPIPKITLIAHNNVSVTTLEEAKRLSQRRDMKLVKINDFDSKTQRPVYQLMTGAEYHQEDLKQRESKKKEKQNDNSLKGEKLLMLNNTISEHDLQTQANKIAKWIAKRYEVKVVISGDNAEKSEAVYALLESSTKEQGRIVQKRQKGNDLKFQILPQKKKEIDQPS